MLFFKGDEESRSRLYHLVLSISSLLILLVAAYFVVRIFTGNPLMGSWKSEETDLVLDIYDKDSAKITVWNSEGESEEVALTYSADLEQKVISFYNAETKYLKDAEVSEENETEEESEYVSAEVSPFISTFSYNIEMNELILNDTEFGDQIVLSAEK